MRILLVWPNIEEAVLSNELSCCEPLPLEYLAAGLRGNHDVEISDQRLDPELTDTAHRQQPDLVGIAVPYTSAVRSARKISQDVRRLWPKAQIVLGGHHASVSSEWFDGFCADYVIQGEAATSFALLANALDQRRSTVDVPGLIPFSQLGQRSRLVIPKSLEDLPSPDRTLVARHRSQYFHSIYRPVTLVRFSVGCPYACTFCSLWKVTERRYITQSAERIVQELSEIEGKNIYVIDDEAFIQPQRMRRLASVVAEARLSKRYHMYVRADTIMRDCAVIEAWADIGLDSVLVGAESMRPDELDLYDKRAKVDETSAAVRFLHSLGIKIRANFIVRPTYTKDDFDRLAGTVTDLGIDLPSFSVLTPLPGTDLFNDTRAELISDNPDLFDCYHTLYPTRLPIEEFYSELAGLLQKTAAHNASGADASPMFYYSQRDAFGRMLKAIKNGYLLNDVPWRALQATDVAGGAQSSA